MSEMVTLQIPRAHLATLRDSIDHGLTEIDASMRELERERQELNELMDSVMAVMQPAFEPIEILGKPQGGTHYVPSGIVVEDPPPSPEFPPEALQTPAEIVAPPEEPPPVIEIAAPRVVPVPDQSLPPDWKPEEPRGTKSSLAPAMTADQFGMTADQFGTTASQLASVLQKDWEGFLAVAPNVPRPKVTTWGASYTPEDYVTGLTALALQGTTSMFPGSSLAHIRNTDGELIGYIHLLEKMAGTEQRERFCAQLLAQQKARVKP